MRKINKNWIELEKTDDSGIKYLIAIRTNSIETVVMNGQACRILLISGYDIEVAMSYVDVLKCIETPYKEEVGEPKPQNLVKYL